MHERANFYHSLALNPTEFDAEVIRKTNETAARAFPSVLDVDHPNFFRRLHRCSELNLKMTTIEQTQRPKWMKFLQKLPMQLAIVGHLVRLYFIKPIDAEAIRETVR